MLFLGFLTQLGQYAARRFGVKEGDVESFGTTAGSLVDEFYSLFGHFVESVGNTVGHSEGYVVDTFAAFLDKLGNGALVRGRFEEFDFGITYLEEGGFYFLVGYFFYGVAFSPSMFS